MRLLVPALDVVLERLAPPPAGSVGLVLALVAVAVLVLHELRAPSRWRTPPGPMPSARLVAAREGRAHFWATAAVLCLTLGVIVVERVVVMT